MSDADDLKASMLEIGKLRQQVQRLEEELEDSRLRSRWILHHIDDLNRALNMPLPNHEPPSGEGE